MSRDGSRCRGGCIIDKDEPIGRVWKRKKESRHLHKYKHFQITEDLFLENTPVQSVDPLVWLWHFEASVAAAAAAGAAAAGNTQDEVKRETNAAKSCFRKQEVEPKDLRTCSWLMCCSCDSWLSWESWLSIATC